MLMSADCAARLALTLYPVLVIIAAASDVYMFRIPNWIGAVLAVAFLPLAFASGMPAAQLVQHLLAGIVLFGLGYLLFQAGIFGGGDAKLLAAAGLWLGAAGSLTLVSFTALSGGVLGLALLARRLLALLAPRLTRVRAPSASNGSPSRLRKSLQARIPYGFAIAVAVMFALPESWWARTVGIWS